MRFSPMFEVYSTSYYYFFFLECLKQTQMFFIYVLAESENVIQLCDCDSCLYLHCICSIHQLQTCQGKLAMKKRTKFSQKHQIQNILQNNYMLSVDSKSVGDNVAPLDSQNVWSNLLKVPFFIASV